MDAARANRIAWIGWGVTLPLAYLGGVARTFTGVSGSGKWPVYAAVAVMLAVFVRLLIGRDGRALFLSIAMSASGLSLGVMGAFVTVALATNRVFPLLLALKWLLAGAFLTWLFRRQLHEDEVTASLVTSVGPEAFDVEAKLRRWLALPGDADVFAAVGMLPPEEQERIAGRMREELERDLAAARARSKDLNRRALRAFATGGVLLLAGMALYMTSALTKAKVDAAQTQPR